MALVVYNTLSRKKEVFAPLKKPNVNFFVCGPTVYNYMHIGHAKTYTQFDVIVKYLRYIGYNVFYLQNITNIDDKIIKRSAEKNIAPLELAEQFEEYYHQDEKKLGITAVNKYARATDYIKEIVNQIKILLEKGYAYKTNDGYYYDIKKCSDYGKLSRRTSLDAEDAVSRIDESIEKRNRGDFCLWKFSKPGEPSWKTKIGEGRPGWHIEDTAITEANFGSQYDIHGGAQDLIFPHHEAEIAQMESISGKKPMVKYWLHTGFLKINGVKMSKSLKNFTTVRKILEKYDYQTLRFFYLNSHYRSPIDFNDNSLKNASEGLKKLNNFINNIKENDNGDDLKLIEKTEKEFIEAMNDDFDTVKAIATIFNFVKKSYKKNICGGNKTYQLFRKFNQIFDIFKFEKTSIPDEILALAQKRQALRQQKKWSETDQIRQKINEMGYTIEDTANGFSVKKF